MDSKHDTLAITFDLDGSDEPQVESSPDGGDAKQARTVMTSSRKRANKRGGTASTTKLAAIGSARSLSVSIHQSSTSLRSTAGDTGSVIWRSSVRLAACLIRQMHRAPCGGVPPLLTLAGDAPLNVLELGSGTGVLPALLLTYLAGAAPHRPIHWTATDQSEMLPLLSRNLARLKQADGAITSQARQLDWIECSRVYRSTSSYAGGIDGFRQSVLDTSPGRPVDLLVAVDCVFNPSLFASLIDSIDAFTTPNHTMVLVLIELRSSDATMQFLETWLAKGSERWQIWTVPAEQLTCGLDQGYAAWIAWRM